jgi:hypothetical protein
MNGAGLSYKFVIRIETLWIPTMGAVSCLVIPLEIEIN